MLALCSKVFNFSPCNIVEFLRNAYENWSWTSWQTFTTCPLLGKGISSCLHNTGCIRRYIVALVIDSGNMFSLFLQLNGECLAFNIPPEFLVLRR